MAKSTFDYFRKHTGIMMAVLCALLMMAFVVADPLLQYLNDAQGGGVRGQRKKVAVTWQGGQLTEGELGQLVAQRGLMMGFLRAVEQEGGYQANQAGVPDVPTRVAPLMLPVDRENGVERHVLQSHVFAEAAREAGMVISDQTIVDYLTALGRDYVTPSRMRQMISSIQFGNGLSATPDYMFGLIRDAMLARSYENSFIYSSATVMPQQRWNDWLKVNDRVVVETAKLNVEDFVDQVEEPTDEELTEYYDEYKNFAPGPDWVDNTVLPSPTPGFRKPGKVQVQWVKADYAAAITAATDEVTDEEIAAFYEANKVMFVKSELDLTAEQDAGEPALEAAPEEELAEEPAEEAAEEPAEDEAEEAAEPMADAEETPAEDSPAEESPAEETPDEDETSGLTRLSPFRFASYQDEQADESGADASETAEPEGEAAEETNPLDEFMAREDEEEEPETEVPSTEAEAPDADEKEELPVEYQPLEEVKEEIRDRLAREKAAVALQQKLRDLLGLLKNDYDRYFNQRIDAEAAKQEIPAPPEALVDWEKLATENGLEHSQTELLSRLELSETPTGRLIQANENLGTAAPLHLQVFRTDGLEMFEPAFAYDVEQNQFLVMKIAAEEESTPELDDIRDQVVEAWKKDKASELALAEAQKLAEKAQASGLTLKEQFSDDKEIEVQESDRFSWLRSAAAGQYGQQYLRLDDPGTVDGAGPAFMKAVFTLEPNQVGHALNHGKTSAHIIRIAQRESSQQELRKYFLTEWNQWRGLGSVQRRYMNETARAVFMDLVDGEAPDWKRVPDQEPQDAS